MAGVTFSCAAKSALCSVRSCKESSLLLDSSEFNPILVAEEHCQKRPELHRK